MHITEVFIISSPDRELKAYVSVTFDKVFVVRNMKIIEHEGRLMLAMPSRKLPNGAFKDAAHPVTRAFREYLEDAVFKAWDVFQAKGAKVYVPQHAME